MVCGDSMDDELADPLVRFADKHLDETLERIDRAFAPMYEGDKELTRTIMSLATAAVVLSMGMTQFLVGRGDVLTSSWLLPVSWAGFLSSVVVGAGRIIQSGAATGLRFNLEHRRYAMRMELKKASAENAEARFDLALDAAWNPAYEQTMNAIKAYNRLGVAMLGAFVIGMLALLAFGTANLP